VIKLLLKRTLRRRSAVAGLALIVGFLALGVFAYEIAPHDPLAIDVSKKLLPSSWEYPMGTDQLGRCLFSRVIVGLRTCLGTGVIVTLAITCLGVPIGLISGYVGGALDNAIMRLVDIATTLPSSMLALALVGVYGPSLRLLIVAFICLWWAPFARLVRSMVIKVKERDFVLAAQSGGCSRLAVMARHIAPNVLSPIIVYATLRVAAVITHVASFSFLGLGSQPPTPDWGVMLNDGRPYLTTKPMLLFWPGLAIMISVLAFNLFGEGLGEALTPDPEDMALAKEDDAEDLPGSAESPRAPDGGAEAGALAGGSEAPAPPAPPPVLAPAAPPILRVRDLKVYFSSGGRVVKALDGVSLDARAGRITAIVGGSGSGKSVLALSIARLIDKPGWIESGAIEIGSVDVLSLSGRELKRHRGGGVAMIFQDPQGSMNPVAKVKKHLLEAARIPRAKRGEAMARFMEILKRVGLADPAKILESYPFELSGGMCQRIMVAMGLVADSRVLIADEPTSNLDLTTQAAILQELLRLRDQGLAIVLITHDLGVVAQTADDVHVIHDGRVVESGSAERVLLSPRMPYTRALLASVQEEAA
jgi:peptide/nickel transport system permease protein